MTKADRLVKNQAIKREYDRAKRQKREPHFPQSWGHAAVGHILDCNRNSFERALRAYWDRLYVGWNPFKKDGRGCWEVWQRPSKKTPVLWGFVKDGDFTTFRDNLTPEQRVQESGWEKVFSLEYEPSDFEHWVADLDFLRMDFIQRLREMDSWENKQLIAEHDDKYEAHFDKLEKQEDENIREVVKDNKKAFRDLLDYTQAGYNPLDFFRKR